MLASIPDSAELRGTQSLDASHGVRCFDHWRVKARAMAVIAWRMIATAGIDASGIVGAYFESGQPWRLYLRHSIFAIIENGGLRQECEALGCVNNHGLRVCPV
ncbi:hypothetical protein [Burkholderia cenocepacia]|uniref:hypothetical protein n=1 Tax=Burkholderia cenocepacia TaxID=95486 RepID=UPI002AB2D7DC|nr:hypothetical protein [Burkholderia cenocepacia]